jgi:hypothetical protein
MRIISGWVLLAMFMLPCLALEAKEVVLQNDRLHLKFTVEGATVSVSEFRRAGRTLQWIEGQGHSLCTLRLQRIDAQKKIHHLHIDTAQAKAVDVRRDRQGDSESLVFTWYQIKPSEGQGFLMVQGRVTLGKRSALSNWHVRVENRLPGWGVADVNFPRLRLAMDAQSEVASPYGLGKLFQNPTKYTGQPLDGMQHGPDMGGLYPWALCTMQMMALTQCGESLYWATHDPRGKGKYFYCAPSADQAALEIHNAHYPEAPLAWDYTYDCSYNTVLGLIDGDWWHCCALYRSWVLPNAEWTQPPLGKSPAQLPDWWTRIAFHDSSYYELEDTSPDRRTLPLSMETKKLLGDLPMTVGQGLWTVRGFDVDYPDFFPARDWFVGDLLKAKEHGLYFLPYTNGVNADVTSTFWKNGGWKYRVIMDPADTAIPTKHLQFICPQSTEWSLVITELEGRVARELQADFIYIDVIGCVPAVECYSADHGHPPGNRCDLPLGIRRTVRRARQEVAKTNPNIIFSMEDSTECYGVEAPLVCNRTTSDMNCPMLMAVYADRIDPYGFNMIDQEYRKDPMTWRMKCAETFIYGMQLGAFFTGKPKGKPEMITFLRMLGSARVQARKYLSVGRMMHPPTLIGDNPPITAEWETYGVPKKAVTRPTVRASSWLAADGTAALAFVNQGNTPMALQWAVKAADLGLSPAAAYAVRTFYPAETGHRARLTGPVLTGDVTVPKLGAIVLSITPVK